MAAITQLAPYAWPGRRYGGFSHTSAVVVVLIPGVIRISLESLTSFGMDEETESMKGSL